MSPETAGRDMVPVKASSALTKASAGKGLYNLTWATPTRSP